MRFEWSDKMGPRRRTAWLLLVKGDDVFLFAGQNISDVAVICGTDYERAGVWSHTTYRLEIASGIRPVAGHDGWGTGQFVEGLGSAVGCATPDTWVDVAQALGVSVPSAVEFLREWRPEAATKLDEVDRALNALDDRAIDDEATETIAVSFGAPTRRMREEGFWTSPKPIPERDGADIRLIDEEGDWSKGNIEIIGMTGTVLSAKRSDGRGGGYVTVTIAVLPAEQH